MARGGQIIDASIVLVPTQRTVVTRRRPAGWAPPAGWKQSPPSAAEDAIIRLQDHVTRTPSTSGPGFAVTMRPYDSQDWWAVGKGIPA